MILDENKKNEDDYKFKNCFVCEKIIKSSNPV